MQALRLLQIQLFFPYKCGRARLASWGAFQGKVFAFLPDGMKDVHHGYSSKIPLEVHAYSFLHS